MQIINRTILSTLLFAALLLSVLIIPAGAVENSETAKSYNLGDADGNGEVDVIDVNYIQRWEAGMTNGIDPDSFLYNADVDGDGQVGILDATLIQRWLAHMDVPYRIGEPIQSYPAEEGERVWPLNQSRFIGSSDESHEYLTISAFVGSPVMAAESGVVIAASNSCSHYSSICDCNGGYGNYVWILSDSGIEMIYGYLSTTAAAIGDVVKTGEIIGYTGATGNALGPSLHFECRQDGVKIDPLSIYK